MKPEKWVPPKLMQASKRHGWTMKNSGDIGGVVFTKGGRAIAVTVRTDGTVSSALAAGPAGRESQAAGRDKTDWVLAELRK